MYAFKLMLSLSRAMLFIRDKNCLSRRYRFSLPFVGIYFEGATERDDIDAIAVLMLRFKLAIFKWIWPKCVFHTDVSSVGTFVVAVVVVVGVCFLNLN